MMMRRKNSAASTAKRRKNEAGKVDHLQIDYSGPSFSDLPNSILVNILLKLSVKRILVCKCVCKTWYDLISDPEFAKIHFDQSEVYPLLRTSGYTLLSRMIYLVQPEHDVLEFKPKALNEFDGDGSDYDFLFYWPKLKIRLDAKLKLPIRNLQMVNPNIEAERDNHMKLNMKNHKYRVVNSCNGLLLLSNPPDNDPVIVCNPVTGEFINLPEVRTVNDRGLDIACGLGFSPLSKQYKVIRMFTRWVRNNYVMVAEVNVLGTDSWKDLEIFPDSLYTQFTTYLNGCVYWYSPVNPYCVICFDIEKECFESISPPDICSLFVDRTVNMGVLGGELFISEAFCFDCSVKFWAMKDDGKVKTWSRIFTFECDDRERWPFGSYQPIKYMNDGALLMFHPHKRALIYKHPERAGFKYFKVHGFDSKVEAFAHVPSLVSLKHALSGLDAELLNIRSRCAGLKLYKETKVISLVEKNRIMELDTDEELKDFD